MRVISENKFEVLKLAVSALTPILVLVLGLIINNSVKNNERSTALRSEIYKSVGGDVNDIYCYLSFVGGWKELTPIDVMAKKRSVDRAMFTYRPFFSKELFATYEQFMKEAFATYSAPGADARIRSVLETPNGDRRKHGVKWDPSWEDRFTKERNNEAQQQAYTQFLKQLARDLKL